MNATLSRTEELRNDINNLYFAIRFQYGVLSELEELGRTYTVEYKRTEQNVDILKKNKAKLEAELERIEAEWIEDKMTELGW